MNDGIDENDPYSLLDVMERLIDTRQSHKRLIEATNNLLAAIDGKSNPSDEIAALRVLVSESKE